jgi:hypothetical protein
VRSAGRLFIKRVVSFIEAPLNLTAEFRRHKKRGITTHSTGARESLPFIMHLDGLDGVFAHGYFGREAATEFVLGNRGGKITARQFLTATRG